MYFRVDYLHFSMTYSYPKALNSFTWQMRYFGTCGLHFNSTFS